MAGKRRRQNHNQVQGNPIQRTRPQKNNKIVRMNKPFRINAALIIFGLILVYVLASVFIALRKEPITVYKVNASNINNNISCEGIALREEKLISAGKTGYVFYYVRDGERVAKNAPICTVDETGALLQSVTIVPEGTTLFSAADYLEIRSSIDTFKTGYSDNDFYNIYTFKNSIESKVLEMSNQILMKEYQAQGNAIQSTVVNMNSPESGIITYYIDGYESLTPEALTEDLFDRAKYQKTILKSGEIVEIGNPVYKMISSENWTICCKISIDQANTLLDENRLLFTINNSEIQVASNYDLIRSGDYYILTLPLDRYMIDYVEDRFVSVEIILNSFEGLKVPNTAILSKEVYVIPSEYMIAGGDSMYSKKLYIQSRNEEGELTAQQIDADIVRIDEENKLYYVGMGNIPTDAVLMKNDSADTVAVTTLGRDNLKGVYIANRGVADFHEITIVRAGDEFTIVSDDGDLREFDNIVMDAADVTENQIIY